MRNVVGCLVAGSAAERALFVYCLNSLGLTLSMPILSATRFWSQVAPHLTRLLDGGRPSSSMAGSTEKLSVQLSSKMQENSWPSRG